MWKRVCDRLVKWPPERFHILGCDQIRKFSAEIFFRRNESAEYHESLIDGLANDEPQPTTSDWEILNSLNMNH